MAQNAIASPMLGEGALAAPINKATRIPALDFVKGALVLIMVLYHWMNYFLGPHDNRFLRFLTPSFICISGFLISHVYLSKYGVSSNRAPKRLVQRGFKIFSVFVLLNLGRSSLSPVSSEGQSHSIIERIIDVYIIGTGLGGGQTKAVAFFILVPISYLLVLCALLMIAARYYKYAFHFACIVSFMCIAILEWHGMESANLELLAMGLLGAVAGYLSVDQLRAFLRHPFILVGLYLLYLFAISLWNVKYVIQVVGVPLSLLILYLLGEWSGEAGAVSRRVVLLGKYSLLGYIAQIAILQILRRALIYFQWGLGTPELWLIVAGSLTILAVEIVDRARIGSVAIDRMYRFVFA